MKSRPSLFEGRSIVDAFGLIALMSLFIANALHVYIYTSVVYYRELFGILFIVLSTWCLLSRSNELLGDKTKISRAYFYLIIFPALLGLWWLIDPGDSLYRNDMASTEYSGYISLPLYVLRNALLYLPMVTYIFLRGLKVREIRVIASVAAFTAPVSIIAYLQHGEIATLSTFGIVAEIGGQGIAYNSFVPYLTFPVLCGIYLIFSESKFLPKIIYSIATVFTGVFCILSTSRQSILFIVLCFAAFLIFSNSNRSSWSKWLNQAIILVFALFIFTYFTSGYEISSFTKDKIGSLKGFTSDADSGRLDVAIQGIQLLEPIEWLSGAGLTSVINSGPHNDYVRWSQRVGFPLMIVGFMPFFIALFRSIRLVRLRKDNNMLFIFLAMVIVFTLFHSLFGYPREDANQAVAVYLGLALWFGALRQNLLKLPARKRARLRLKRSNILAGSSYST